MFKRSLRWMVILVLLITFFTSCGKNVEKIALSTNQCEIVESETYSISFSLYPEGVEDDGIKFKSEDEAVATVDENGTITGVSPGQTTISVSASNGTTELCYVTVLERSAYERLTTSEKKFVDTISKYIYMFKNPESLRIQGIMNISTSDSRAYIVDITAQNSFGGNTMSSFLLCDGAAIEGYEGYSNGLFDMGTYLALGNDSGYDLALINEALNDLIVG